MTEKTVLSVVTALARELSDPIRLAALQLLTAEGPHSLSQLADALRVSAPRMSNHLTRLREAELVEVAHTGRHAVYRSARDDLGTVLDALTRFAHGEASALSFTHSPTRADLAHTCYDHAAGRLGVSVFRALVDRGALSTPDGRDELAIGHNPAAFTDFGVDPDEIDPGRRKLATACLDRTHRLPHLGGALGEAVLSALLRRELVAPVPDSRALTITPAGDRTLPTLLANTGWSA
jgi:DNA-binding transcriptional ArsR family regulator